MTKIFKAIGLMSGTSLDGIDLAMIESDGVNYIKLLDADYAEYSEDFRNKIRLLSLGPVNIGFIKEVENEITILHANLVNNFLLKNNIEPSSIDLIGFHGQTIFHNPNKLITWQIGNSQLLALKTQIRVVGDFRVRDVLEGGQGAPLVPIYHYYLFSKLVKPCLILNIGGVSNLTYFDENLNSLQAFDLCFGNAPANDLMLKNFNKPFDENGDLASLGTINYDLVDKILTDPIFHRKLPRSYSRNDFDEVLKTLNHLEAKDILANYSQIIAELLARIITTNLPKIPQQILVCGGGAKNKNLLKLMQKRLPNIKVITTQEEGYNVDSIEAEAFAFLAIRRVLNLPISFAKTTATKNINGSIGGIIFEK